MLVARWPLSRRPKRSWCAISRPSGTWMVLPTFPSAEALGYLQSSLRDLHHLRGWISRHFAPGGSHPRPGRGYPSSSRMRHERNSPRQPLFWGAVAFSLGLWTGVRAWRPASWWVMAVVAFVFAAVFF